MACHWFSRAGLTAPLLTWLCSCQRHCLVMDLMEMPAFAPLCGLLLAYPDLSSSYKASRNYSRSFLATWVLNVLFLLRIFITLVHPLLLNLTIYWTTGHSFCRTF